MPSSPAHCPHTGLIQGHAPESQGFASGFLKACPHHEVWPRAYDMPSSLKGWPQEILGHAPKAWGPALGHVPDSIHAR